MIVYRSHDDEDKTLDDIIEAVNSLDSTNIYEVGGWNITYIVEGTAPESYLSDPDGNIVLDSENKAIYINDTTYGNSGIQLEYNSGTPRVYIGDGADQYFQYDGTNISWKGTNTELTAGGLLNVSNINADGGNIGGFYIAATTLSDNVVPASSNILLDSANSLIRVGATSGNHITIDGANQYIKSSNYASGATGAGFYIDDSYAEFGDIRARGKFTTLVMEYDAVSAIGGSLLTMKGSDILDVDMTALDASTLAITGSVNFEVGDMLQMKDGVNEEWFEGIVGSVLLTQRVYRLCVSCNKGHRA